jgi:hypothetical protein
MLSEVSKKFEDGVAVEMILLRAEVQLEIAGFWCVCESANYSNRISRRFRLDMWRFAPGCPCPMERWRESEAAFVDEDYRFVASVGFF